MGVSIAALKINKAHISHISLDIYKHSKSLHILLLKHICHTFK